LVKSYQTRYQKLKLEGDRDRTSLKRNSSRIFCRLVPSCWRSPTNGEVIFGDQPCAESESPTAHETELYATKIKLKHVRKCKN